MEKVCMYARQGLLLEPLPDGTYRRVGHPKMFNLNADEGFLSVCEDIPVRIIDAVQ